MRKLRRPLAVLIGALVFAGGGNALVGTARALPHFVTISPPAPTLAPGASQTFTVSGASGCCIASWTFIKNASGATLHASGVFRALYTAGTTEGVTDIIQVTVQGGQASTTVTVSTIAVSPPTVTLPPRGTQPFTASGGTGPSYAWELVVNNSGGSLSADGVYVAGPTGSVIDTIRVTDSAGHSAQLSATVTSAVTLMPPSAALLPLGSLTFTASGGSGGGFAWTLSTNGSSGAVTQDGVYTAGSTDNTHDVVTVTDSLGNMASATVAVGSPAPLTIRPSDVIVPVRTQVAFFPGGGNSPYRWAVETSASGGHSIRGGWICRYFCWVTGGTAGGTDVISVTDALGATARANVRVGALSISPQDVVLLVQGRQQFIASGGSDGGYTWTLSTNASEGSIDPVTGWYTAGTVAPTTDVVRVTDSDGGSAEAQAHVIFPPMLVASPSTSTLPPRASEEFSASGGSGGGYSWAFVDNASGGTLTAVGAYRAGATGDVTDVILLTDSLGHSVDASVNVTAALRVSPPAATLKAHESRTFNVSGGSGSGNTWVLSTNRSGGTLTEGLYTAGATGGVTDVLRVTDSLGAFAEATITVTSPQPEPKDVGCGATGGPTFPLLALAALSLLRRNRSTGRLANFGPNDWGRRLGRAILPSVPLLLVFSACGSGPESTEGTSSTSGAIDATSSRQAGERLSHKNGRIAWGGFVPFVDQAIFSAEPDGSDLRQLTFPEVGVFGDSHPNWSPDGAKILFERDYADASIYQGVWQIFAINADGSGLEQVGHCVEPCITDVFPNYSPTGSRIAFSRALGPIRSDGNATEVGIWIMRSDGTDPVQITQRHLPTSSEDILATWSPDGRRLVFTRVNTTAEPVGHQALFVGELEGEEFRRITPWALDATAADWSPDGELILFTSHHDTVPPGREQLYMVRPDGSRLTRLTPEGLEQPANIGGKFSPNGKRIVFRHQAANYFSQVYTMNFDGSDVVRVSHDEIFHDAPAWGTHP